MIMFSKMLGKRLKDRFEAGEKLAERLEKFKNAPATLILAIPRGSLQVGQVLAQRLNLPLDIVVTKKIGAEQNPEYAIAAVDEDGEMYGLPYASTEYIAKKRAELIPQIQEKVRYFRKGMPKRKIEKQTIILIDDGIATGLTMQAATMYLRRHGAEKIILVVPVAAKEIWDRLSQTVDEAIVLDLPADFYAVGQFYEAFPQVSDEEAKSILQNIFRNSH